MEAGLQFTLFVGRAVLIVSLWLVGRGDSRLKGLLGLLGCAVHVKRKPTCIGGLGHGVCRAQITIEDGHVK